MRKTIQKQNKAKRIGITFCLIGLILFAGPGIFTYRLQENSYGRPNELFELARSLEFPMSLTTLTYLFSWSWVILGYIIAAHRGGRPFSIAWKIFVVITIMNVGQEIMQAWTNPYPDTHWLDLGAGFLAVSLFLFIVWMIYGKYKEVP